MRGLNGCANLAAQYSAGRGVPLDVRKAEALYIRACDGGAPIACANLAALLDGRQLPADPKRTARLLKRACDAGDAPSCDRLRALEH